MPVPAQDPRHHRIVVVVIQLIVVSVFLLLFGRIVYLQIYQYDIYSPISERNSVRQQIVNPARGLIFDRHGELIVGNEPSFTITITPLNFDMANIPLLAELTHISEEEILQLVQEARTFSRHRESRLLRDVDFRTFSNIQENLWRLPGINHQVEGKRSYPSEARLSHVLGYLAEVTRGEMTASAFYRLGDLVGRSGIERVYEEDLRGNKGTEFVTVNAFGRSLGPFNQGQLDVNPVQGLNLHTTIDVQLQRVAEELLEGKVGGVVALNPQTGGILAIASAPDYDNSRLAGRMDRSYWQAVNADSLTPLFNRAVATLQPPGSTTKPMMGLIGMRLGLITENTTIHCNGGYMRGRFYRCLRRHGDQTIAQAIETSCNTFFYALMDQIVTRHGLNVWTRMMNDFGMGVTSGADLTGEVRGLVPDSTYFNRVFGVRQWGLGDMINLGIGQGAMGTSPLQMAIATAAIANNGNRVKPHIVDRISYPGGDMELIRPEPERIEWINPVQLRAVQMGMRKAVTDGSGRFYANLRDVAVAGKTGTAQNPHGQNHGWFIAYAPFENPEIVIAVLLQNAGFGSISAAPLAGMMFEQYFYGEIRRPHVYRMMLEFEPAPFNPDRN
ncbi:MAG: penicillin-binding protein 2 [Candidatus Cyclonatronum sp.]|uniref:penicillin-binding protein 2 n=1 Tax=Cyclonatronum sp. TaxID=3024185 RepID=UPI0025BEDEB7|nr:penicillin-binding protein 2 [Cyclonatronum sp.]MCC5934215.1 penicillin-binding protein 2 [Balneolales bacterium]MCH8487026.1 penicillin-binding protein 2 [Cyclonatronum sp.]